MYDIIISGAGPAGLSAAITAGRLGLKTAVIEKGDVPGPEPRGESMPEYPLINRLLGDGALKNISHFTSYSREFHSPGDLKSTVIKVKEPYYFFEWRKLIDALWKEAESCGADFFLGADVTGPVLRNGIACGVEYRKDGRTAVLEGKAVLGCGGRTCPVASFYDSDGKGLACPTVKYLGRNASYDRNSIKDLQFYMVLPDSFKSVRGFPPAFAYIFPFGDGSIEAGLMLRLSRLEDLKGIRIPSDEEIMKVWEEAKKTLPGFSDFFNGTETEYEQLTSIQNRGMIKKNVMGKGGAVLIGDSMGLVDANGSSGVYYSMAHAEKWVNLLNDRLKAGLPLWEPQAVEEYYRRQSEWDFFKYISKSYKTIAVFEGIIFKRFGEPGKINALWGIITKLLQSAS